MERAHRLYEAEVAYVDREIGRLLDRLSALALDEKTLVVLTSDHGEEFLDHGDWEHGHTLYDELLRVPLVLRQPGRVAPGRIAPAVGLVDLAPTILAHCGLPRCDSFVGRDLAPALAGGALPETDLLAYGNFWGPPRSSLRRGELAFILNPDGSAELYRWTTDPGERTDLAAGERAAAEGLRTALQRAEAEGRPRRPGSRARRPAVARAGPAALCDGLLRRRERGEGLVS
jgi:arylsulfatase A-like enzyme